MYSQVDSEGKSFLLLNEITNHRPQRTMEAFDARISFLTASFSNPMYCSALFALRKQGKELIAKMIEARIFDSKLTNLSLRRLS